MAPISAKDVAKFLEENPGFFLDHPELVRPSGLLDESVEGEEDSNLINIKERLFERLAEERLELMGILEETIDLVRENERIESDFLAIEGLLFRPTPGGVSLGRVAEEIEERFSLDYVGFLLFGEAKAAAGGETDGRVRLAGGANGASEAGLSEAGLPEAGLQKKGVLLAGPLEGSEGSPGDGPPGAGPPGGGPPGAGPPFPEDLRADLRSTATILLRDADQTFGLLLLGSKDPGRYAEGMATQLLERLAARLGMGIRLLLRFAEAGLPAAPSLKAAPEAATKTA